MRTVSRLRAAHSVSRGVDAASVVVFDGQKCVQTDPGHCGCDYFCDLTFQTMEACQAACSP